MRKNIFVLLMTFIAGVASGVTGYMYHETREVAEINRGRLLLTPDDSLKQRIWLHGDTDAYAKLQGSYRDYPPENFLFWAMYMANKYDYSFAYEDVFRTLEEVYNPTDSAIFKMDDKTRQFALGYLKKASEKGDTSATNILKELKEKDVPAEWLR